MSKRKQKVTQTSKLENRIKPLFLICESTFFKLGKSIRQITLQSYGKAYAAFSRFDLRNSIKQILLQGYAAFRRIGIRKKLAALLVILLLFSAIWVRNFYAGLYNPNVANNYMLLSVKRIISIRLSNSCRRMVASLKLKPSDGLPGSKIMIKTCVPEPTMFKKDGVTTN